MTKARPSSWICSNPDCPHEKAKKFNSWVRESLPDSSTGFLVTDLDLILFNYKSKRIMLLEIKTHGSVMRYWQKRFFQNLDRWLSVGIDLDWEYKGFHTVQFESSDFKDGRCYFDEEEITEEDLICKLSML